MKILSNQIKPLIPINKDNSIYGSLDIETVSVRGSLYPYAAGFRINNILVIKHAFSYLNKDLHGCNVVIDCIKELLSIHNSSIKYVMVHNLGGFDGVYIVSAILKLEDYSIKDFNVLVDASGNYIQIQYKNLIFRDSYRIFPAPLSKLSQMCNTLTCKSELDHDSVTLDMIYKKDFYETSSEYLKNDINVLYEVIEKLKTDLIENYKLPLRKVYSASNMAFQVYRTNYQKRAIGASCKRSSDIAHEAFYGGSTQLVKSDMLKGYYYDVNSLYPAMMLKPLPVEKLNTVICTTEEFIAKDLFGFVICKIYVPDSIILPQVPVRYNGSLIYPHGKIVGCYFTEEVKSFINLGYQINTIACHTFSKEYDIFADYINTIYKIKAKKDITPEKRYMVKLLLNGLYGYFARSQENVVHKYIKSEDFTVFKNKNILDILDLEKGILKIKYVEEKDQRIKANPAISSAVASYARAYMHKYSTMPKNPIIYKDTDSIIVKKPLSKKDVSQKIGKFKLEYKIEKGIFLKSKIYALKLKDGREIIKAAGIPKGRLTLKDYKELQQDPTKIKNISIERYEKSMEQLCIERKTIDIKLKGGERIKRYKIEMDYETETQKSVIKDIKEW